MELRIIDCTQGTPEWFSARQGRPTASRFRDVLSKGEGKVRTKYMRELACEIVRGGPSPFESYSNSAMDRGTEYEPEARELYTLITGNEVKQVGFMIRGPVGYSPDGLIGDDGLLEIKTRLDHLQAEVLLTDKVPAENVAQLQGGLWVSGRQWIHFVSYSPGLPLFIKRVTRDEPYIARLKIEVEDFLAEADAMVLQLNNYTRSA